VLIGLTLAVTDDFVILLVVLVFHQTFEGLGLGSRLAYAQLPAKYARYGPYVAALVFSFATPLGIAIGLGVRHSYTPNGATASIVSGILDALSAGILIYTGLVEVSRLSLSLRLIADAGTAAACARIHLQQADDRGVGRKTRVRPGVDARWMCAYGPPRALGMKDCGTETQNIA
jgi:hypothetical protein